MSHDWWITFFPPGECEHKEWEPLSCWVVVRDLSNIPSSTLWALDKQWNVYRVSETEKNAQLYTSNVGSASLTGARSVGCRLSTWDFASATIFLKLVSSLGSHSKMSCWNVLTGGPLLLHCLFAGGKLLLGQFYDWFPISTLFCNFPFQFVSLSRNTLSLNNSGLLSS